MANIGYIQVTRKCNQECKFCSNPPTSRAITVAEVEKLIDSYKNSRYEGVVFTGGEPTLYPWLDRVIEYAVKEGLPARIVSNGQKLSDMRYCRSLYDSGLRHVCLSVYSDDSSVQGFLTGNKGSFSHINNSLRNLTQLGVCIDIVTVINKYNAGHLSRVVAWLEKVYPQVHHYVWNNLDPLMNRASLHRDTIPRLNDFELELHRAMEYLTSRGKTFRVERVPLCYMTEFSHCSTETRKIVKHEERTVYFLDKKGLKRQLGWVYGKASCCQSCSLNQVCAGLYQMDRYYFSRELHAVFVSKDQIINRILNDEK